MTRWNDDETKAPACGRGFRVTGIELAELTKPVKHGRQRFTHTYRWLCDVPLRDGADAMTVNWLMIEIRNAAGEVTYRNSFITDLPVDRDTVVELVACGRARWKIENESFNTLKTKGYNSNTISATESSTCPPSSPPSTCWPSPSTPLPNSPMTFGSKPSTRQQPAPASSSGCDQSPSSSCFPLGRTC